MIRSLAIALLFTASAAAAQNGGDDPLPLRYVASPCDARASILNIVRPVNRYFKTFPNDGGLIALLDLGGPEATRYHILLADRIRTPYEEQKPRHCRIISLAEQGLALTRDFQIRSISTAGGTKDARRSGPGARISMYLLHTDMTDGRYVSDAVGYVHLDSETGMLTLELWSISEPRLRR